MDNSVCETCADPSCIYSVHVQIREHLTLHLLREGGLKSLELTGDLNLNISDAAQARIKLGLSAPSSSPNDLLFKQHPNVGKFSVNERVVALKDLSRSFPVGQPLSVLKWRYSGRDESLLPLSGTSTENLECERPLIKLTVNIWPTQNNNGTCDVNVEYELENAKLSLHDVTISIPLPSVFRLLFSPADLFILLLAPGRTPPCRMCR